MVLLAGRGQAGAAVVLRCRGRGEALGWGYVCVRRNFPAPRPGQLGEWILGQGGEDGKGQGGGLGGG